MNQNDILSKKPTEIYTDGACSGNPGWGGWGVLLRCGDKELCLCDGEPNTTNNRMELRAAIEGLKALKRPAEIIIYTDSKYVRSGITEWMPRWISSGWKTAAKKPVKNQDLWKTLAEQATRHKIDWRWVKGHAGDVGNETADGLARQGLEKARASMVRSE